MRRALVTTWSIHLAALTVGLAFISSVVIVTIVDDFLLPNFVVPGDTAALAQDIEAKPTAIWWAAIGYLCVLALDAIIGLALFVVLWPASKALAKAVAVFRLLYVGVLVLGIVALLVRAVDAHGYASFKQVGYVFFALHILLLGFAVWKSGYLPKWIGLLLLLASLTYATFFVDFGLSEAMKVLTMLVMAVAELSLSAWLLIRRKTLPGGPGGRLDGDAEGP
ncbi:DUF4386 domain-containing protein [Hydrogenophaga sp. 5NK40-0174]|uniref:DUF4386 domain-containing protein n=1 Tax=Hydrogenophaga sp. 5NK40-0174 TaxID=3127649 RepID=UPI0031035AF0